MWFFRKQIFVNPAFSASKRAPFIDRHFQTRLTRLVLGAMLLSIVVISGPIIYFVLENYGLFERLALDFTPQMTTDLEREKTFLLTYTLASIAGVTVFIGIYVHRVSIRMAAPLKVLNNHLKLLSRGDWNQRSITIREADEFRDLIEAYNYFYSSFQASARHEIKILEMLKPDFDERIKYVAWKNLLDQKKTQLQTQIATVETLSPRTNPNTSRQVS